MKTSWQRLFPRLALAVIAFLGTAFSSLVCHAVQLAYDDATKSAYNDGWQGTTTNNNTGVQETTGDNGGFGFEPWNFDTDWLFNPDPVDGNQTIDDGAQTGVANSSTFNNLGPPPNPQPAWRIGKPFDGLPRAGRGFPALQVGQTFRVVIDNPTERQFFKGYFVRFNSRNGEAGGGNICYDYPDYSTTCSAADLNGDGFNVPLGATPEPKLNVSRFEYTDFQNAGRWKVNDGTGTHDTSLWDTDGLGKVGTDAGVRIELKITATDTYLLTMTPLDNTAAAYTLTGTLETPGEPIDWLEFTFFNTDSEDGFDTDFFIKSLEIFNDAPAGVPGDYNNNGKVDGADYVVWRDHSGAFQLTNEVAGVTPGQVTQEDYAAWRARFGNTSGSGSGGALGGTTIPEPSACVYLLTATGGWLIARTRKRLPRFKGGHSV